MSGMSFHGKKSLRTKIPETLSGSALDELHGADGAKEKDGRNLVGEGKSQQKWAIKPQKNLKLQKTEMHS